MLLSLRLLRRIARELPRYGKLTYCLYRDPRVPQRNKIALAAAMALILNPVVDVPLRLPIFGEMDAVALTVLAIRVFVEKAPKDVVAEHQEQIRLPFLQEGVDPIGLGVVIECHRTRHLVGLLHRKDHRLLVRRLPRKAASREAKKCP